MPIFFYISGYLINIEKLKTLSALGLLSKYSRRMLFQWIIAICIFTFLANYPNLNISSVGAYIYDPYYHLWFVPTLFVYIVLLWVIDKFSNIYIYLCLLGIVSAILLCVGDVIMKLSSGIRLEYFLWFALGIISKRWFGRLDAHKINSKIVFGGGFLINIFLISLFFFHKNAWACYKRYFMIAYCLYLCLFIVYPYIVRNIFTNKILKKIGQQSLEIYLWHMLPIMFLKKYLAGNILAYYMIGFSLLIIFALSHYLTIHIDRKL